MTDTSDLTNVREAKERERRQAKYKFALVRYDWGGYQVEHKRYLDLSWWVNSDDYQVLCDWEPERVLRGMLKLLKEDK